MRVAGHSSTFASGEVVGFDALETAGRGEVVVQVNRQERERHGVASKYEEGFDCRALILVEFARALVKPGGARYRAEDIEGHLVKIPVPPVVPVREGSGPTPAS